VEQRPGYPGNTAFQGTPEFRQINFEKLQDFTGGIYPLSQEGDNNMLRQELIGIKAPSFFLSVPGKYTLYPPC
jgi:hypothetical protein